MDPDPIAIPLADATDQQEPSRFLAWARSHRTSAFVLVLWLAVCVAVAGFIAYLSISFLVDSGRSIQADPAKLRVVEQRLQPVLQDFRALTSPPDLRPVDEPRISGCYNDGGDAVPPHASREWQLQGPHGTKGDGGDESFEESPRARAAVAALGDELVRLGWIRELGLTPGGQILLSKEGSGYTIKGTVSALEDFESRGDVVRVAAAVDRPMPCTLE